MNKIESLKEIIEEAKADETFARKYEYWTVTKRRNPDSDWLFKQLKDALGAERFLELLKGVEYERL